MQAGDCKYMMQKKKNYKYIKIIIVILVLFIGVIYYVTLSRIQTEWGEYETSGINTVVRRETPVDNGVVSSSSFEYDGDFYRKRRINGTLVINEIMGECVLEIYEGDIKKYSNRYGEGNHIIDYEWEHFSGEGDTRIIFMTDGIVYDAVVYYKLYSKSSKLNYKIQRIKRYLGMI